MRTIKKHQNRKLYDLTTHKYTNSRKLIHLISQGEDFQIIRFDGEDVTNDVLSSTVRKYVPMSNALCKDLIRGWMNS